MSIELQRSADGVQGHFSGAVTIYEVSEIQRQLSESCTKEDALILNLADVTELDTAGLQLLMALRQHLGPKLVLQQHSQAVIEMLDLYRLVPFFGDVIILSDH